MGIRQQTAYLELKKQLDESRRLQSNLLIVTLPGTGLNRLFREYVEEGGDQEVQQIQPGEVATSSYNLVHWDWDLPNILPQITQLLQHAHINQHFAISVNFPGLLSTPELKNSYFLNHIYRTIYFGARNKAETFDLLSDVNPDISKADQEQIYQQSGGLAQLAKLLAVKADLAKIDSVVDPISKSINGCSEEVLEKLDVFSNGRLTVGLIGQKYSPDNSFDIITNFDLSFSELGKTSDLKLTSSEKNILDFLIANHGQITKENIADIKWGVGKYDKYSDQAIKQQVLRLGRKLTLFELIAIPGVGYKLQKK